MIAAALVAVATALAQHQAAATTASRSATTPNATIAITPATAQNQIGTTHTLTAAVMVDDGAGGGLQPAQDGVHVTFSIVSGPGSFVGPSTCKTGGHTGSCTAVITSTQTGTTEVRAATDVQIGKGPDQTTLHRETGDSNSGDSVDAQKTWLPCSTASGGPPSGITVTPTTTANGTAAYEITFAQPLSVNDNSYSSSSPTPFWNGKQHKFQDLVGSDKAEFLITNGGTTLFDFALDYISQDKTNTVSGYSSLGPFGGDGSFTTGDKSAILGWSTSEANNLNTFCSGGNCTVDGVNQLTDSPPPANPSDESAGAAAPFGAWQYQDIYTVTIAASALPANFSKSNVSIPLAHNSPAKSTSTSQCPSNVNATIAITPGTAQNPVGSTHTLTATVLVDQGTGAGLQPAQDGLHVTFSIVSGPGSFVGPSTCKTGGHTGTCTAVITSTEAGTTVVRAATDVQVGKGPTQTTLHRETNDTNSGDSADAQKVWFPCQTGGSSQTFSTTLTTFNGVPAYKLTFTQPLSVNDNAYSSTSPTVFWNGKQHKFQDLVGSDKAEFVVTNGSTTLFDFFLDYLSAKSGTPSGYGSLGPFGGDGSFVTGNKSAILGWTTTLDDNLNTTGYCSGGNCSSNGVNLLTDSPPPVSTSDETQGAAPPFQKWNFVDGYTVYIAASALPTGFSNSNWTVPFVHNSPAKSNGTTTPTCGNVTVTKTADQATVNAGGTIGFTVTINNGGTATAHGVTLSDPLPSGTASGWTIDTSVGNPGSFTISGNQLTLSGPTDLAAGSSLSVHVTATTDAAHCTIYDNTATVASSDANGGQASATTTCQKTSVISLAYADSYDPRADQLPGPWVGGVTYFVGCGSSMTGTPVAPGSAGDPCQTFTDMSGAMKNQYDGGAIMIVNNVATPLTITNSMVVESGAPGSGSCTYNPWPGLDVTLQQGESVILAQTGLTSGPTPSGAFCPGTAQVGQGFDFDTSEAGGNAHCTDSGLTPVITLTLNGVPTTITDTARLLNHQGVDIGACPPGTTGTSEFTQWTPLP